MRTIFLFLAINVFSFFACKKKEEPAPAPAPAPVVSVTYPISVKIDGIEKHCSYNCYSGIYSGGFRELTLDFAGSAEQVIFSWNGIPATGQYTLVQYGEPYARYGKGSFVYGAKQGLLTISSIDTASNGAVNKISASFSFKTDTVNGLYFNLTDGLINLK